MKYEEEYHNKVHNLLINDNKYYQLKGFISYERFFSKIPDLKSKKILEYGCGLGQNIYSIRKLNVLGYDISKFALNFCRNKGIKIINKKSKIPKCDIILCIQVLEHLDNPLKELKFFRNKLKEGGILILGLPKEKNFLSSYDPDNVNYHLYSWNFRTINNLLNKTGFKVIKNEKFYARGYKKLKFIGNINFKIYYFLLSIIGRVFNDAELKIVAKKN